jgi:PleD family two-component response regulator
MSNFSNSYTHRIKGLSIPPGKYEAIEADVNRYIDNIERYTQQLEDSYSSGNTSQFISAIDKIQGLLQPVYAVQAGSYASVLLRAAQNQGLEYCEKVLRQAIADFLLLSIEMQKAQNIGIREAMKYKKIERNEEIARNLSAIERYISSGYYDRALELASSLEDMDTVFAKLAVALRNRDYKQASEMASTVEKEHVGHIQSVDRTIHTHKVVLAVDDRPEILSSVSVALREHYRVFGAPSGKVALDILEQNPIDLFILDIDMPEMDGFELARAIRSHRKYSDTTIVFLTGNASRDNILRATRLGASDFIVKPVRNIALLAKIRNYMD